MGALFSSGHIVDLILGLVVAEAFAVRAFLSRKRLVNFAPTLLSGAFLLLAIRAALVDASWEWVAAALTAALVCHAWDIASRLDGGV